MDILSNTRGLWPALLPPGLVTTGHFRLRIFVCFGLPFPLSESMAPYISRCVGSSNGKIGIVRSLLLFESISVRSINSHIVDFTILPSLLVKSGFDVGSPAMAHGKW